MILASTQKDFPFLITTIEQFFKKIYIQLYDFIGCKTNIAEVGSDWSVSILW